MGPDTIGGHVETLLRVRSLASRQLHETLGWTNSLSLFGSGITQLALPLTAVVTLHASTIQMGVLNAAQSVPFLAACEASSPACG